MAANAPGERSLQQTPTWAIAVVCAGFVVLSLLIEHAIHSIGKWFQKRRKKAMSEALEKIKAELMLLGFISLLLTGGTRSIAKICIPFELGDTMLPCKIHDYRKHIEVSYAESILWRRVLAGPAGVDHCSQYDKVPLISQSGLHQLHIFIFVLAGFHVLYSVLTMALAQVKMNKWKAWELETSSLEYQFTNDPARFRLTHQTSFVKRHSGFSTKPGIIWIAHFASNSKFNFHKYIKRSMEDDFKMVVGISIPLWIFAVILLLLNVYKWYTLAWLSLAPLVILLLVGTKLEVIIIEMAQEIQDRATVVKGAPVVEPTNKYFGLIDPSGFFFLIHFTLFQNAFQMAYFCVDLYAQYEFGMTPCFKENLPAALTRVSLGVALLILCSYITFPLYALVTQMGSHMKKAIFEEQTAKALKKWQQAAKDRRKLRKVGIVVDSLSGFLSVESTLSRGTSPLHLLHKHRLSSKSEPKGVPSSPRSYQSDTNLLEIEGFTPDRLESRMQDQPGGNERITQH